MTLRFGTAMLRAAAERDGKAAAEERTVAVALTAAGRWVEQHVAVQSV